MYAEAEERPPQAAHHIARFFSKWGSPSLCIEEMHTAFFYYLLLNKDQRKALQQSYKLKQPPNTGVKAPPN
jgi:hypothetical protein